MSPRHVPTVRRILLAWSIPAAMIQAVSFIASAERKFGFLAVPNIIRIIAGFQALVYLLVVFTAGNAVPDGSAFYHKITLDPDAVFRGEIWRLVTFIFIPRSWSMLMIFFSVYFLWFVNDGLQQAWGSFRLTLFVLSGMLIVSLGSLFLGAAPTGFFLLQSFIIAFAILYPTHQILLMMIIPIQMRFLALIMGGVMAFQLYGGLVDGYWPIVIAILLPFLNIALFMGPGIAKAIRHRATAAERKARFQAAQQTEGGAFYTCERCGKTDDDHPDLEFRVTAEGEELCDGCRGE